MLNLDSSDDKNEINVHLKSKGEIIKPRVIWTESTNVGKEINSNVFLTDSTFFFFSNLVNSSENATKACEEEVIQCCSVLQKLTGIEVSKNVGLNKERRRKGVHKIFKKGGRQRVKEGAIRREESSEGRSSWSPTLRLLSLSLLLEKKRTKCNNNSPCASTALMLLFAHICGLLSADIIGQG